ncbi:putative membrane protein YdbT with pleckstrin-like domain [Prauserella isguenensis]|uniref:Putative membrane protein YdbT with pleckstrin-like domain n=1 Tax=Prauserella isguenensis TaxID=1470180 RepID=A0A839S870_9PSEU|nr:PH domain-containing protein [Prauserella isguenensis]MBB3053564.1 putative membrane protein YdbT with pleckstrin-like domain [Prauserella isguenensis]
MSYPFDQIGDDETVLVHSHQHWKCLILPGLGGAVLAVAAAALMAAVPAEAGLIVAAAALIGLSVLVGAPIVRWKTTHFVVTDQKVMFREGVLRRSGMNIPIRRITSVRYEHDLNDRIFGCGSLIVEAMSEEPLTFTDIPHVEAVHNTLYDASLNPTSAL